MRFPLILFFTLIAHFGSSQMESEVETVYFLISAETKSYNTALRKAQKVSNDLSIPLNLRNYYKDTVHGLTTSEICGCGENHGYIARGRSDNGTFVSIEHSSGFNSFENDFYLVVISSGNKNDVENEFIKQGPKLKNASVFKENVYMGCMH